MKNLMLGGAMLLVISVGNAAVADTTSAPANDEVPKGQIQLVNADALYSTKINGIDVPFQVLTYAHTQHLGYAVTDAAKVNRGGETFYRLTLERDLNSSKYSTVQLYYNMKWWLIDEADIPKLKPKPEPVAENRDTDQQAAPEPAEPEKPEPEPEPEPEKPEKPEKPEPAPQPEPKPEPSEPEPSEEEPTEDDAEEKTETTETRDSDQTEETER